MKTYIGFPNLDDDNVIVRVGSSAITQRDHPLRLRLDLANHSPTGFAWGYGGSGPAQLALAMLADHFGDDRKALRLYQRFKDAYLARLDMDAGFVLTDLQIDEIIAGDVVLAALSKEAS